MSAAVSHLLYLHGFRSSPRSTKARQMQAWMRAHRPDVTWACPQLPPSPREAMALIDAIVEPWPRDATAVIGSSLGGFYATALAERTGCRAVLLNPAVAPARDLQAHTGPTTTWHGDEPFDFRPAYVDELRELERSATRPARYFLVVAKGDEVLSWREMVGHYPGAGLKLLDAGDHGLSDFPDHLPDVVRFLGL